MARILIIEDDLEISGLLSEFLLENGYQASCLYNGLHVPEVLQEYRPDLVLLDLMLPYRSGDQVLTDIRAGWAVPVIIISAKGTTRNKIDLLRSGADDYVTKPFGVRELMARVKANLRKSVVREETPEQAPAGKGNFGKLDINPDRYEVRKDGRIIDLTVREFELLKYLSAQKGQVFSRETLLEKVWGYEYFGDVRTVDVTIRRLREKIEDDPGKPVYILTKRGVGYYFDC